MKEIKVYVGKNLQSGIATRADQAHEFRFGTINLDQIKNLITGYNPKNRYIVYLDRLPLYTICTLRAKDGYNVITATEKRIWFGNGNDYCHYIIGDKTVDEMLDTCFMVQHAKKPDIIDLCATVRKAEKYNMTIYVTRGNTVVTFNDLPELIQPGGTYNVSNWHTPEDVGTAISYINKMMKAKEEFVEINSSYFGSDKTTKLYMIEPVTLRFKDLNQFNLKDWQLTAKTIRLTKDNEIDYDKRLTQRHENLLVNVVGGYDVSYSAITMRHSALGEQHNVEFDLVTRQVTKDGLVGTQTLLVKRNKEYVVETKWCRKIYQCDEQEYFAVPKYFKQNGKIIGYNDKIKYNLDIVQSIKLLTGYELADAVEVETWLKPEVMNYMVQFNSENQFYKLNNLESILSAAMVLKNKGSLTLDTITLTQARAEDHIFSDSERADEEDVVISELELVNDEDIFKFEDVHLELSISEAFELEIDDDYNYTVVVRLK